MNSYFASISIIFDSEDELPDFYQPTENEILNLKFIKTI